MKVLMKSKVSFDPLRPLKILVNYFNHHLARTHINNFPQQVIFAFDHIGLSINLEGRYENNELSLVEQYIMHHIDDLENKSALDIGANIGNHSLTLAKYFKNVYSFEPNPITYEVLTINSKYRAENNIIPLKFGLSSKEAILPFVINSSNIGGSFIPRVSQKFNNPKTELTVQVKTLDSIKFLMSEQIGLIKIDVEGHELDALKGGEELITRNSPHILFEQGIDEINNGCSEVINYLSNLGYEFFVVKKRYYLGESIFLKMIGLVCSSIFGHQYKLIQTKTFKKSFYSMILAIPNK